MRWRCARSIPGSCWRGSARGFGFARARLAERILILAIRRVSSRKLGAAPRKRIVLTTTNGSRALRACVGAETVLIGSFLNLGATATYLLRQAPPHLLLVCSGTGEQAAYEDILGAGALAELVWPLYAKGEIADSAQVALQIYQQNARRLSQAIEHSRNGRRLLAQRDLRDDVPYCLQRDVCDLVAKLENGSIKKLGIYRRKWKKVPARGGSPGTNEESAGCSDAIVPKRFRLVTQAGLLNARTSGLFGGFWRDARLLTQPSLTVKQGKKGVRTPSAGLNILVIIANRPGIFSRCFPVSGGSWRRPIR